MKVGELIQELQKHDPNTVIGIPTQLERSGRCVLDEPEIYPVEALNLPGHEKVLFIISKERNANDSQ